jgi:ABC-2 type transport system ATP-binding protein
VGGERLEVTVAVDAELELARAVLEKVCGEAPTVDQQTRHLSAPVGGGGVRALLEVVRLLDAAGIEPVDIGIRRATLDDVFLKLTGLAAGSEEELAAEAAQRSRQQQKTGGAR